jgi:hypothetical protein
MKISGRWKDSIKMDFKDIGYVHVDFSDGLLRTR